MTASHRPNDLAPRPLARHWHPVVVSLVVVLVSMGGGTREAGAQAVNPVYVDDSPAASEALQRAGELARVGNTREAAEVLMRLLQDAPDQVIAVVADPAEAGQVPDWPNAPGDPEADMEAEDDFGGAIEALLDAPPRPDASSPALYHSIRSAVHQLLLSDRALLQAYRQAASPMANRLLEAGNRAMVERSFGLTEAGFEAAMQHAGERLARAEFFAAYHTLRDLDAHPDRRGGSGRDRRVAAARLLAQAVSYAEGFSGAEPAMPADEAEAILAPLRALRDRWFNEAGLGESDMPPPANWPSVPVGRSSLDPGEPAELAGMLPRPLATARLTPLPPDIANAMSLIAPGGQQRTDTQLLFALPTLAGDDLFLNTGDVVSCFDRFTLAPRWSVNISTARSRMGGRGQGFIDDPNEVIIAGGRAITITGVAIRTSGNTGGDERLVVALDRRDGRVLWSQTTADLVPFGIEGFDFAGVPVVSEGTVVVMLERLASRQREQAIAAVGFDLASGSIRWVRSVGSTGTTSFVQASDRGGQPLARGGMVYLVTRAGVMAALEAHTGRVRWSRTEPSSIRMTRHGQPSWTTSKPILLPEGLLALSPDRTRLLLIDPDTGHLKDARSTNPLGSPLYLIRAGSRIFGITNAVIFAIERSDLFNTPAREHFRARSAFRSRVTLVGDRLLVPMLHGAVLVPTDPDRPFDPDRDSIELSITGNIVASDGQLVVINDNEMHSYLLWDRAASLLRARLTENPQDPTPAIVLVELAYYAGRAQAILDATDEASARLATLTDPVDAESARSRLFAALLEVVEPRSAPPPGAAELSIPERDRIVSKVDELARTPDERISAHFAAATLFELTARPAEAVERYQRLLSNEELVRTEVRTAGASVPAGTLATRRLRRVVALFGTDVYRRFDAEAQRSLARLDPNEPAEAFEAIARRYPLATAAIDAWAQVADRALATDREQLAIYALEEGLRTTMELAETDEAPGVARMAGRLLALLIETDRTAQAMDVTLRLAEEFPSLLVDVGVGPRPIARVLEVLDEDRARRTAMASIGLPLSRHARQFDATTLAPPAVEAPSWHARRHAVIRTRAEAFDRVAAFTPGHPTPDPSELGWPLRPNEAVVAINDELVLTGRHLLMEGTNQHDLVITARDADTGQERWLTPGFRAAIDSELDAQLEQPNGPRSQRRSLPLHGSVPLHERVVLLNHNTLIIVERTGVVVGYDLTDGSVLWTTGRIMNVVHDAWLDAGVLAIGGLSSSVDNEAGLSTGLVVAIEARTGRVLSTNEPGDQVRWVRTMADARLAIGLQDDGIIALDPFRAEVQWRVQREELVASLDAWTVPAGVVVRDANNQIWLLSSIGGLSVAVIDTGALLDQGFQSIEVKPSRRGFMITTAYGVAWYGSTGQPIGIASDPQGGGIVGVAESREHIIIASTRQIPPMGPGAPEGFRHDNSIRVYESSTGRLADEIALQLPRAVEAIKVLDGVLLISTGSVLITLDAPAQRQAD